MIVLGERRVTLGVCGVKGQPSSPVLTPQGRPGVTFITSSRRGFWYRAESMPGYVRGASYPLRPGHGNKTLRADMLASDAFTQKIIVHG